MAWLVQSCARAELPGLGFRLRPSRAKGLCRRARWTRRVPSRSRFLAERNRRHVGRRATPLRASAHHRQRHPAFEMACERAAQSTRLPTKSVGVAWERSRKRGQTARKTCERERRLAESRVCHYPRRMSSSNGWPSESTVLQETQAWLSEIVIGLELCPFAKPVHVKGQIRYQVSTAETVEALLEDLLAELRFLSEADPESVDTTLLVHPRVLTDFLEYNDFLSVVDVAVEELELDGVLQVASFHPDYRYEGNAATDPPNCVTRSPYPMLHLLRESSVERAVAVFPDASKIVNKNIATLHSLGLPGWQRLMERVRSKP